MTNEEVVSVQEYIQALLAERDKAVLANNEQVQRSLEELKTGLIEIRKLHGEITVRYVTTDDFHLSLQQRFDSVERLANQLVESVDFRFQTIEKQTALASTSMERRLDNMNEFRAQIADTQRLYMPKAEYEAKHAELIARVNGIDAFTRDAREQHHDFIRREEHIAVMKDVEARFTTAEKARDAIIARVESLERFYANLQGRIWAIGIGITILTIVVATILHFIPV